MVSHDRFGRGLSLSGVHWASQQTSEHLAWVGATATVSFAFCGMCITCRRKEMTIEIQSC